MKQEIKIIPKLKEYRYEPPQPKNTLMPRLHFSMIVSGPRGSGKSLFVRNLLLRKDMLYDVFKKPNYIIVICPNVRTNGDYAELEKKENCFLVEKYTSALIKNIIDQQVQNIKQYGRNKTPEILIVLDDILDSGAADFHSATESLFTRGRHININVILITQHLNRVSYTMRVNSDYFVLFKPANEKEMDNIIKNIVNHSNVKKAEENLREIFNLPYNFLFVDGKEQNKNKKFRINLNNFINLI